MATLRAFLAIPFSAASANFIKEIQQTLSQANADVKWVEPHNIHLTLKFLGDIKEKSIRPLVGYLTDGLKTKKIFTVRLNLLGAFPSPKKPRIIWVGMEKGASETIELARTAEESAGLIGIKKEERPFSPHTTIGRVRSFKNLTALTSAIETYSFSQPIEQTIIQVILFKSTLTSQGPIYESLQEIQLQ
jgi:RNA 2',3'-cyclic 3'-phosphodiesterase